MRRLTQMLICTAMLCLFIGSAAHAQKPPRCAFRAHRGCPISIGAGVCNYWSYADVKKGDDWQYVCTNVPGGDYEWWYDDGVKGNKVIARSIYAGGRNSYRFLAVRSNWRNPSGFWHVDRDSNDKNHITVHAFRKVANMGVEIEMRYNKVTSKWEEIGRSSYGSLPNSMRVENSTETKPPEYSVTLALVATSTPDPTKVDIRWSPPTPTPDPVLTAGDLVYIHGVVNMDDIMAYDARFNVELVPEEDSEGVVLTAKQDVPIHKGDILITLLRPLPPEMYYAVEDVGADAFYQDVLDGEPLGDSWSTQEDLRDMVGYAATAGTLLVPSTVCNVGNDNLGCWSGCQDCDEADAACSTPITSDPPITEETNFTPVELALVQDGNKINRFQEAVQDILAKQQPPPQIVKITTVQAAINAILAKPGSRVVIFGHGAKGRFKIGENDLSDADVQTKFIDALKGELKSLTLYGCEVSDGAEGQAFLKKLTEGLQRPVHTWDGKVYAFGNDPGIPEEMRNRFYIEAETDKKEIPAVTEWGMVVMVLLVLAAGTVVIRRARTVAAQA